MQIRTTKGFALNPYLKTTALANFFVKFVKGEQIATLPVLLSGASLSVAL